MSAAVDELERLGAQVDLADRVLGQANMRMTEFRIAHPEFSGRFVLRPERPTLLDLEFRALQGKVNAAQQQFTNACVAYANAKP